jgi:hypothetical protein
MMQQQKEREREGESDGTREIKGGKPQEIFGYNARRFHFFRWFPFITFLSLGILAISDVVSTKRFPYFYFVMMLPMITNIISWEKEQKYASWLKQHKDEKIAVDEEGIHWYGKDISVYMRWEEITQAYKEEDDICVLVKQGGNEEEIRFWNSVYLTSNQKKYHFFETKTSLAFFIEQLCPLLKSQMWEQKDPETIAPKTLRSAYQTADAQIFSYHTKVNKMIIWAPLMPLVVIPMVMGLIATVFHIPLINVSLIIVAIIFASISVAFFRWQWYVKSQIETDDLGIAFIEPKGVTWRVLWFTIETYTQDEKFGILTTKDGKTYKFPLNTARASELEAGIRRRLGAD